MSDLYDTTVEQVRAAMAEMGTDDFDFVAALLERGNTVEQIKAMTPNRRLTEWLDWHYGGGISANRILRSVRSAGFCVTEPK